MQLLLIILGAWFALALLALPFVLCVSRAAQLADIDAMRHHEELVMAAAEPAREPARAVR